MPFVIEARHRTSPIHLVMRIADRLFGAPVATRARQILLCDPTIIAQALAGPLTAKIVEDRDAGTVTPYETKVSAATTAALATLAPRGEKPLDGLFRISQLIVEVKISDGGSPSATQRAALWAADREAVAREAAKAIARLRRIGRGDLADALLTQSRDI